MYPLSYLLGLNRFKNGAWYDPSGDDQIIRMLELLKIEPNDHAVDIGSGDGRVVIAMAKLGAQVVGIEANPQLVTQSTNKIIQQGLSDRARIIQSDIWQQSYHKYNKVVVYQFKTIMERLEKKLLDQLPTGAKVVSNYWRFPHWEESNHIQEIYLYINK